MYSREDYIEVEKRLNKDKLSHDPGIEILQQAAISQDLLTKDDKWDYYLSLIQHQIEITIELKDNLREKILSPDIVNADEQQRIKNHYLQYSERLNVLEAVIKIPKQIMDKCEKIKLDLKEVE